MQEEEYAIIENLHAESKKDLEEMNVGHLATLEKLETREQAMHNKVVLVESNIKNEKKQHKENIKQCEKENELLKRNSEAKIRVS